MKKYVIGFFALVLLASSYVVCAQEKNSGALDSDGFLKDQPFAPEGGVENYSLLELVNSELSSTSSNSELFGKVVNMNDVKEGEIASCFDYYSFGSIKINLSTDNKKYSAGDPVLIRGTVQNSNNYPVVGLDIRARLVKDIPEADQLRSEIIVLDEFDIAENVTMPANGEFKISYSHLLPANAPSGQYQVYFYAVEQDRFNLSGLSFTNDIVGSSVSFNVEGNIPDHVYLDQTQITVADQSHNVMAFMTQHEKFSKIPVKIPLYNPESEDKAMTITYNLYSWDSANPKNKIDTKVENVVVPAKSEYFLTYTIEKGVLPVYNLSITAVPTNQEQDISVHNEKTISNVRFIVQDVSKARINFTGVSTYPLKKGDEATLVTCFHNTSNAIDESNTRVETSLRDSSGRELAKTLYEGPISSDIVGIIQKFKPKAETADFTVYSKLVDSQGNIIDQVEKKYSCKDIDPSSCPKKQSNYYSLLLLLILAIVIGVGALVLKSKKLNITRV